MQSRNNTSMNSEYENMSPEEQLAHQKQTGGKVSLIEIARDSLRAKAHELDANVLIGNEYSKMKKQNLHSINYLRELIEKDPDQFDNRFRNV
jgi:hypothetical protein